MAKRPVFVFTDDSLLTVFAEHFNSPTTIQHITAAKNYNYHGNVLFSNKSQRREVHSPYLMYNLILNPTKQCRRPNVFLLAWVRIERRNAAPDLTVHS